ncbi:MAG: hypothetical protein GXX81_01905 [Acidobacteria bacterium]|nr:hypothetical protein [Acidobacteriota bacterium]
MNKLGGLAVILVIVLCISSYGGNDNDICFEGKIEKMAPPTFASGVVPAYRLVRYQVIRVLKGTYREREIVVDHLVMDVDELEKYHPGDIVCLCVEKVRQPLQRWNAKGIRDPDERVQWYFIDKDLHKGNCKGPNIEK